MEHQSTSTEICTERRRHERREINRPCKVLHTPSFRYMAATTRDISRSGVRLELSQHRPLTIGERIDVLVDWDQAGLVSKQSMVPARVVRLGRREGLRQEIGIEFEAEQALRAAA